MGPLTNFLNSDINIGIVRKLRAAVQNLCLTVAAIAGNNYVTSE